MINNLEIFNIWERDRTMKVQSVSKIDKDKQFRHKQEYKKTNIKKITNEQRIIDVYC